MFKLREITAEQESKYYVLDCDKSVSIKLKKIGFGLALTIIKDTNLGMRLPHWKKDVVVRVQKPDKNSKMTAPYLYVESRFGKVPWKETMIELFSNEWEIVE